MSQSGLCACLNLVLKRDSLFGPLTEYFFTHYPPTLCQSLKAITDKSKMTRPIVRDITVTLLIHSSPCLKQPLLCSVPSQSYIPSTSQALRSQETAIGCEDQVSNNSSLQNKPDLQSSNIKLRLIFPKMMNPQKLLLSDMLIKIINVWCAGQKRLWRSEILTSNARSWMCVFVYSLNC